MHPQDNMKYLGCNTVFGSDTVTDSIWIRIYNYNHFWQKVTELLPTIYSPQLHNRYKISHPLDFSCSLKVIVLRSYDTMASASRNQPEGTLVYITDNTDLYIRVREGCRKVLVSSHSSYTHSVCFVFCSAS